MTDDVPKQRRRIAYTRRTALITHVKVWVKPMEIWQTEFLDRQPDRYNISTVIPAELWERYRTALKEIRAVRKKLESCFSDDQLREMNHLNWKAKTDGK